MAGVSLSSHARRGRDMSARVGDRAWYPQPSLAAKEAAHHVRLNCDGLWPCHTTLLRSTVARNGVGRRSTSRTPIRHWRRLAAELLRNRFP